LFDWSEKQKKGGVWMGFNIYYKKAIFFSAFDLILFSNLAWALLNGSIDSLAASNQTCH
jgi:hypothetical protein